MKRKVHSAFDLNNCYPKTSPDLSNCITAILKMAYVLCSNKSYVLSLQGLDIHPSMTKVMHNLITIEWCY
jgi:hypothetical protein